VSVSPVGIPLSAGRYPLTGRSAPDQVAERRRREYGHTGFASCLVADVRDFDTEGHRHGGIELDLILVSLKPVRANLNLEPRAP
jgi:hypothetical protein